MDDEIVGLAGVLLLAGHITTTALLGNAILSFDRYPQAAAEVRADRSLLPAAIEEVLRHRTPFPRLGRMTTTDVELGGRLIPARSVVIPWVGAANRDPRRHLDPQRFDIHRAPGHLAFGHGIHFCLGAPLARLGPGRPRPAAGPVRRARRGPRARAAPEPLGHELAAEPARPRSPRRPLTGHWPTTPAGRSRQWRSVGGRSRRQADHVGRPSRRRGWPTGAGPAPGRRDPRIVKRVRTTRLQVTLLGVVPSVVRVVDLPAHRHPARAARRAPGRGRLE